MKAGHELMSVFWLVEPGAKCGALSHVLAVFAADLLACPVTGAAESDSESASENPQHCSSDDRGTHAQLQDSHVPEHCAVTVRFSPALEASTRWEQ